MESPLGKAAIRRVLCQVMVNGMVQMALTMKEPSLLVKKRDKAKKSYLTLKKL